MPLTNDFLCSCYAPHFTGYMNLEMLFRWFIGDTFHTKKPKDCNLRFFRHIHIHIFDFGPIFALLFLFLCLKSPVKPPPSETKKTIILPFIQIEIRIYGLFYMFIIFVSGKLSPMNPLTCLWDDSSQSSLLWPKICLPVLQSYCSTRCSWFTVAVWQESNTAYICSGINRNLPKAILNE